MLITESIILHSYTSRPCRTCTLLKECRCQWNCRECFRNKYQMQPLCISPCPPAESNWAYCKHYMEGYY